jgi:hypothetical protein
MKSCHYQSTRNDVRGARVKWLIFGVLIPLLPVGARFAAAWLDGRTHFDFATFFGDGELLVLATVVAAASVGEVLFSFQRDQLSAGPLRTAVITASALVVVVLAVLFFGLVTYANQTQADAQARAHEQQLEQRAQEDSALEEALSKSKEADALRARRKTLTVELGHELEGSHGGEGPFAARTRAEINELVHLSAKLEADASRLRQQAQRERELADQGLEQSTTELHSGREQAAIVSIMLFSISLLVAFPAVTLVARQRKQVQTSAGQDRAATEE